MQKLFILLKEILMLNDSSENNIGLSRFKNTYSSVPVEKSIRNKDIRLSDLMRRY